MAISEFRLDSRDGNITIERSDGTTQQLSLSEAMTLVTTNDGNIKFKDPNTGGNVYPGGVITIKPSGDTSGVKDLANLKAAHDEAVANGSGAVSLAPGGMYYIGSAGLDWRTHKVSLYGNNAIINTTGDFLRLVATSGDTQFGSESSSIENMKILGSGGTSKAIHMYSTTNFKSPRPTLKNLHITGFNKGIYCTDRAYLAMFYNICIDTCVYGFHQAVGSDAGENISWFGGCIGNSQTAILLEEDTSQLNLFGVSIDYCTKFADIKSGILSLYGCHLERHSGWTNSAIDIAGDSSTFQMYGGDIIIAPNGSDTLPYNFPAMVSFANTNNRAIFKDVKMTGIQNVDDTFSIGTGLLSIEGMGSFNVPTAPNRLSGVSGAMNLVSNGGFESSTIDDQWHVVTDSTGTYTSQLVSGNMTMALSTDRARTGTKSLKLTHGATTTNGGAPLVVGLSVPIPRGRVGSRLFGKMYLGREAGAGSTIIVRTYWAKKVAGSATTARNTYGAKRQIYQLTSNTIDTTGISTAFIIGAGHHLVPAWADEFVMEIELSYTPNNTSFYIDDLSIEIA